MLVAALLAAGLAACKGAYVGADAGVTDNRFDRQVCVPMQELACTAPRRPGPARPA
jgi:hypothetical protein